MAYSKDTGKEMYKILNDGIRASISAGSPKEIKEAVAKAFALGALGKGRNFDNEEYVGNLLLPYTQNFEQALQAYNNGDAVSGLSELLKGSQRILGGILVQSYLGNIEVKKAKLTPEETAQRNLVSIVEELTREAQAAQAERGQGEE